MEATDVEFHKQIRGLGVHDLLHLDDLRICKGYRDALLRQEICERFDKTRDNGGTTLTFCEWKEAMRNS